MLCSCNTSLPSVNFYNDWEEQKIEGSFTVLGIYVVSYLGNNLFYRICHQKQLPDYKLFIFGLVSMDTFLLFSMIVE